MTHPAPTTEQKVTDTRSNSADSQGPEDQGIKNEKPANKPKQRSYELEIPGPDVAPYVSIALSASGIHPATSRLLAFSAVFFDSNGTIVTTLSRKEGAVESIARSLNTNEDPGPWQLHGIQDSVFAGSQGFSTLLGVLFNALHHRTVILHDVATDWGFISSEFKRVQRNSQRSNRSRARRVLFPKPTALYDVLGTAYRQSLESADTRLRALPQRYPEAHGDGTMPELSAVASAERAAVPALELLTADAILQYRIFEQQDSAASNGEGDPITYVNNALTADPFGLQRSKIRVKAMNALRPHENPGIWDGTSPLVEGMEVVISPDIQRDQDMLISAATEKGLVYSEKLNRTTSFVVSNLRQEPWGKVMHAQRKDIPVISDEQFMELLDDVQPGVLSATPATRPRTPVKNTRKVRPAKPNKTNKKGTHKKNPHKKTGAQGTKKNPAMNKADVSQRRRRRRTSRPSGTVAPQNSA